MEHFSCCRGACRRHGLRDFVVTIVRRHETFLPGGAVRAIKIRNGTAERAMAIALKQAEADIVPADSRIVRVTVSVKTYGEHYRLVLDRRY